jgi:hypothetical protein
MDALFAMSEQCSDTKDANLSLNAANLLKKNAYPFHYLLAGQLEGALRQELQGTEQLSPLVKRDLGEIGLSLVSFEEMDGKMALSNISRPIEHANSDQLIALGRRLSLLLERSDMSIAQNPFRPEVFLSAVSDSWREFDPDADSHRLILPLLTPEVFLDLAPILQAVNDALVARGVLPELATYQIKKTNADQDSDKKEGAGNTAIAQQLRRMFGGHGLADGANFADADGAINPDFDGQMLQASVVSNQLLGYLAGVQRNMFTQPMMMGGAANDNQSPSLWANIKSQAPAGAMTRVDETTIDLLTKIFDVVFRDQNIPGEIKELISFLQVPVLKAALVDKDFFFKEEHPARRLIEVLSKSGVALDQKKGQHDPLYQKMKRVVDRVQGDTESQGTVFSDVVTDLESFIKEEEEVATTALATPITKALQQEKVVRATKSAKGQVSHRIGTGEVVAFLESFLESRWVPVLTIAYSLEQEKPEVVQSAIKTMDELIWSVKPKITLAERKDLISKLPSILASLNKWLNIIKWNDADRLQFFAELAECHASIVRAPLAISPERQLEIAMEVAKKAAERRLEKRASAEPEPVTDKYDDDVTKLERGMWLDYTVKSGEVKRVKLAWVSPMRSLYIFTTPDKVESFSVSTEELAQCFREKRAHTVQLGGLVDRALVEALGANDDDIHAKSAA